MDPSSGAIGREAAAAYIALGDSISIDDYSGGPGCGGASLLFRNRDDDFPQSGGLPGADRPAPLLAPAGRVVVGTVYDPSDGTGDASRLGLPPWPDAVRIIAELNEALRHVAAQHGSAVAEIGDLFCGHGILAGDPSRPEPRPAQRGLWFCNVIEPNAWGASGVREAFWAALQQPSF